MAGEALHFDSMTLTPASQAHGAEAVGTMAIMGGPHHSFNVCQTTAKQPGYNSASG